MGLGQVVLVLSVFLRYFVSMVELFRTNDPVLLSWMVARLKACNVEPIIFDQHTSLLEGNVSAIPRRIMVPMEDLARAKDVVREAEEIAQGLRDPLD